MMRPLCLLGFLLVGANVYTNALSLSSRRAFISTGFASTIATSALPAFASVPETGAMAPDFDLPNSRGEGTTSLRSLIKAGKWTILYFYPGAFTSGCTLEARGFQAD